MRAELLISWAATVAAVYAILLATYVATCVIVIWLNRGIAGAKIQARETSPAQIRRDQRQSVVSLAAKESAPSQGQTREERFTGRGRNRLAPVLLPRLKTPLRLGRVGALNERFPA